MSTNATSPDASPIVERLAYRPEELAAAFGVSKRTLERERAAGRFPPPDCRIGRVPLWTPGTIRRWVEQQAKRPEGRR